MRAIPWRSRSSFTSTRTSLRCWRSRASRSVGAGKCGASDRRGELRFTAVGLDGGERSTIVSCALAETLEDGRLRAPVDLHPGEEALLDVRFDFVHGREADASPPAAGGPTDGLFVSHAGADAEAWLADRCRVTVDDELVERVLRRSLLDMRMLASELDGHRYYAAGVPWYATLFGRDSIIAALQTLAFDRRYRGRHAASARRPPRLAAGR